MALTIILFRAINKQLSKLFRPNQKEVNNIVVTDYEVLPNNQAITSQQQCCNCNCKVLEINNLASILEEKKECVIKKKIVTTFKN